MERREPAVYVRSAQKGVQSSLDANQWLIDEVQLFLKAVTVGLPRERRMVSLESLHHTTDLLEAQRRHLVVVPRRSRAH